MLEVPVLAHEGVTAALKGHGTSYGIMSIRSMALVSRRVSCYRRTNLTGRCTRRQSRAPIRPALLMSPHSTTALSLAPTSQTAAAETAASSPKRTVCIPQRQVFTVVGQLILSVCRAGGRCRPAYKGEGKGAASCRREAAAKETGTPRGKPCCLSLVLCIQLGKVTCSNFFAAFHITMASFQTGLFPW